MELTLKIPCTKEEIKSEIAKLLHEIEIRDSETEILRHAIDHYQRQCDHKGQKTGYNDRDGSWAAPCPTCGHTY